MMMIRALLDANPRAVNAINTSAPTNLVFINSANRIWVPNAATRTALDNSGDPITLLTFSAIASQTGLNPAFVTAALSHFYFDAQNNLRLDTSWNSLSAIPQSTINIASSNAMGTDANSSGDSYYPADRCTWRQDYDGRNYIIHSASFYPGNTTAVTLHSAELGYIGKSGRFVEIAG